ncbi:class I glutamine amidotransferase-like protein [Eremomyces bilateralis CBS 781.70]|uniref:Class I glutamine amidotransferase-like protein n=1 Tax=Eremomyces bilateralis CBS 781.70 TaxID=1392243 RepID=A0A6G1G4T7_9PEZI|nr:class I glutamine amidotransferase-like protein [Eremomyces bilateralis CBS 781.70]KAF1813105.1 class I glutamine amidotransferase-like protein [Eremomyces bilateralis CBS 781.70]
MRFLSLALCAVAVAQVPEPPVNYGIVLFPGFQAMDVFGPLDVLNTLSMRQTLNLYIFANQRGLVPTKHAMEGVKSNFGEAVMADYAFNDTEIPDLDVLIVPGGAGTRDSQTQAEVAPFLSKIYPQLQYLVAVCTGSALVARTGILDRRRATTNKLAWEWATSQGPNVDWVPRARWVRDGDIWTGSGITASLDTIYAFVAHVYGEPTAANLSRDLEYVRWTDADNDPFGDFYNTSWPIVG